MNIKLAMTIITDAQFADFLANYPLYNKLKAASNFKNVENNYTNPLDFEKKAFKYKCPKEKDIHTFRTKLYGNSVYYGRAIYNDEIEREHALPPYFDKDTLKLDLTVYLQGICQSCNHTIDFLIKTISDESFEKRGSGINIYILKIGQFPAYDIEPEITLQRYLTEEDNSNYKKALTTLSVNFGIGSYAYFRRIIENEIKRIIKDISELDFDGSENVKQAYKNFESDHQMSKLINAISKYLPNSFKELGDNPIRLLYEQLSGGIHQDTDDECIEKAKQIDILLKYTIRKVNEEKFQLQEVKTAIQKLRKSTK